MNLWQQTHSGENEALWKNKSRIRLTYSQQQLGDIAKTIVSTPSNTTPDSLTRAHKPRSPLILEFREGKKKTEPPQYSPRNRDNKAHVKFGNRNRWPSKLLHTGHFPSAKWTYPLKWGYNTNTSHPPTSRTHPKLSQPDRKTYTSHEKETYPPFPHASTGKQKAV